MHLNDHNNYEAWLLDYFTRLRRYINTVKDINFSASFRRIVRILCIMQSSSPVVYTLDVVRSILLDLFNRWRCNTSRTQPSASARWYDCHFPLFGWRWTASGYNIQWSHHVRGINRVEEGRKDHSIESFTNDYTRPLESRDLAARWPSIDHRQRHSLWHRTLRMYCTTQQWRGHGECTAHGRRLVQRQTIRCRITPEIVFGE